jgi:hypothetical protein
MDVARKRNSITAAIAALIVLAGLTAVSCGDDDDQQAPQTPTPTPVDALPILKGVGDGLPRDPGLTVDEEYIYTGGEFTESVYWSKDPAQYAIHFYWEHLPPAGWDVGSDVPTLTAQPTNEKDPNVHQGATLTATRGGFTVTVTVVDNVQKDPARGTVRVGVAIERTDAKATVPPILPSPTQVESGY